MPRNDIIINNTDDNILKIKKAIGIEQRIHTVLYAPTVREINDMEFEQIKFEKILSCLKERFGGKWKVLLRAHLGTLAGAGGGISKFFGNTDLCIDVSNYSDMQELLCIADALITDYSSSIWDYSFTENPCFLYVPDLDEYISKQRGFYIDIYQWGFPIARSNSELAENITKFNEQSYKKKIENHHAMFDNYENGHATEAVIDYIKHWNFI